jgi:hypothetical protein
MEFGVVSSCVCGKRMIEMMNDGYSPRWCGQRYRGRYELSRGDGWIDNVKKARLVKWKGHVEEAWAVVNRVISAWLDVILVLGVGIRQAVGAICCIEEIIHSKAKLWKVRGDKSISEQGYLEKWEGEFGETG